MDLPLGASTREWLWVNPHTGMHTSNAKIGERNISIEIKVSRGRQQWTIGHSI